MLHRVAPALEYEFAGHGSFILFASVVPEFAQAYPAGQGRHVTAFVAEYVPGLHGVHVAAPISEYVPAAQGEHDIEPAAE